MPQLKSLPKRLALQARCTVPSRTHEKKEPRNLTTSVLVYTPPTDLGLFTVSYTAALNRDPDLYDPPAEP